MLPSGSKSGSRVVQSVFVLTPLNDNGFKLLKM